MTIPAKIIAAIYKASSSCEEAPRSGQGRDHLGREYRYASLDDVLLTANAALTSAGLVVIPSCLSVEYGDAPVVTDGREGLRRVCRTTFAFILATADGEVWQNGDDVRLVEVPVRGGTEVAVAQAFALKSYLKGLLRIRTGEPDLEEAVSQVMVADRAASRVAPPPKRRSDAAPGPKEPTFPFDFGAGVTECTAEDVLVHAESLTEVPIEQLDAWLHVNRHALSMMQSARKPQWLRLMRLLKPSPATPTNGTHHDETTA